MRVFNKDKTQEIFNYSEDKGYLFDDKIEIGKTEEIPFIEEKGHYEVVKEYPNGGRDVIWIVDKKGQEYKASEPIYEDIKIFVPFTEEEILDNLRMKREVECFMVINRGKLWYNKLSENQLLELNKWYNDWLNVTETKVIPETPIWLK